MSTTPLDTWPKWRNDLIFQLRLKDVPGDKIGDILLEIEEHVRESGETPEQAFGPATAYADNRANADLASGNDGEDVNLISQMLLPGLGGFLLASGAFQLGGGEEAWGSTRSWLMLIAGIAMLSWVFIRLPVDLIRDPRSGTPLFRERRELTVIMLSGVIVAAGLMYGAGRIMA